jgi:hypothetical protein
MRLVDVGGRQSPQGKRLCFVVEWRLLRLLLLPFPEQQQEEAAPVLKAAPSVLAKCLLLLFADLFASFVCRFLSLF